MKPSGIITLITDFGDRDWYAGVMKGVVLGINPSARIIDLTHGIKSGHIIGASLALRSSYRFFPRGTVHLVVVDPGVGGKRRLIVTEWEGYYFLAPDNGILWGALGREALRFARALEDRERRLKEVSATFHGRDILAPAAAHLSKTGSPSALGPKVKDVVRLDLPRPEGVKAGLVKGTVLHVDHFGNLITNIDEKSQLIKTDEHVEIAIRGKTISGLSRSYDAVPPGELLAVRGSSGFLEISVRGGNAAGVLNAGFGTRFTLKAR